MSTKKPTNQELADLLEEIADLLEQSGGNRWRTRSYRAGARTLRQTTEAVAPLAAAEDVDALKELPDIGEGLAQVLIEYVTRGRSTLLEELKAESDPVSLFKEVPGIGEELAERIVDRLQIRTLPELEQAAHDGRLDSVPGFGPERLKTVRTSLAGMLSGAAQAHTRAITARDEETPPEAPPVAMLLDVDREYREKAEAGELKTIAPKRFNPEDEAWLPILNTERSRDGEKWNFTALYSNTARAHELDKTDDWVVIYWRPEGGEERQNTVVTETSGPLAGERVVRGREAETARYYEEDNRGND